MQIAVSEEKKVLDACCGSRMFWFDRQDARAVFVDKRRERHTLPDVSSKGGSRELVIDPDHQADFTALPFADQTFALVVFDPPHFERNGATGWVGLKYGTLKGDWRGMLRAGFAECFRVLEPGGVLVFKWNETQVALREVLALTPERAAGRAAAEAVPVLPPAAARRCVVTRGGWSLVAAAAVAMTAVVWLARGQRDAIVYAGLAVAVMAVHAAKDRWSR